MESLAVRWLFEGREVTVESRCLDCTGSVRLRMRDDEMIEIDPESAVGYMPSPFAPSRVGSAAFN
jgi:hypothetical protein